MPSSRPNRSESLLPVLILQGLLSLSACTTPQPKAKTPEIPPTPAPAECLKSAFESFAPSLEGLPANWRTLSQDARARAALTIKNDDSVNYRTLRVQAIRCAPEH